MKLAVVCIAAMFLLISPGAECAREIRLCGRMLAEALSLLCAGEYYEPDGGMRRRAIVQTVPDIDSVSGWLMAQGTAGKKEYHSRQSRGVVDECCRNSCTPSVLLSYCG